MLKIEVTKEVTGSTATRILLLAQNGNRLYRNVPLIGPQTLRMNAEGNLSVVGVLELHPLGIDGILVKRVLEKEIKRRSVLLQ